MGLVTHPVVRNLGGVFGQRDPVKAGTGGYPTSRYFDLFLLIDKEPRRIIEWATDGMVRELENGLTFGFGPLRQLASRPESDEAGMDSEGNRPD